MLKCNKCNRSFENEFRYCTSCGTQLVEFNAEITTGENVYIKSDEADETEKNIIKETCSNNIFANKTIVYAENFCKACGEAIFDGESFCIRCGESTKSNVDENAYEKEILNNSQTEVGLQHELRKVFKSNKIFKFFYNYAVVFAFCYPIYLIVTRLFSNDFVVILEQFSNIAFYCYYAGLVALYSKKSYLPMIIAISITAFNSVFSIYQSNTVFLNISKLAILAIILIYLFKKFCTTDQYRYILTKLNFEIKTCPHCHARINKSSMFCSKCGYEMENIL